jgi:hypothetical protein
LEWGSERSLSMLAPFGIEGDEGGERQRRGYVLFSFLEGGAKSIGVCFAVESWRGARKGCGEG